MEQAPQEQDEFFSQASAGWYYTYANRWDSKGYSWYFSIQWE